MLIRGVRYAAVASMLLAAPASASFVPVAPLGGDDLGAQSRVERPFDITLPPPVPVPPAPAPTLAPPRDEPPLPPVPSSFGIPASALDAYQNAADEMRQRDPSCRLHWSVLAGIGKVESGHAYGGAVDRDGDTVRPIVGLPLNGNGTARIKDSDNGRYDGDRVWDRAVGPMQFIPSTWRRWGTDGNGDGRANPSNLYDAALSAGRYLCVGDRDLSTARDLRSALFSYNHSQRYVDVVLSWARAYSLGGTAVPDGFAVVPASQPTAEPSPSPEPEPSPAPVKPKPTSASKQSGDSDRSTAKPSPSPSPTKPPLVPAPVTKIVKETVQEPVAELVEETKPILGGVLGSG